MESLSERTSTGYQQIHDGIIHLVDSARTETVRSVNALMINTIGNSADTICRIPIGKDLADAVCQIERLFDISTAFVLHLLFSVCIFMQINEGKLP